MNEQHIKLSRVGKRPIVVPKGVDVDLGDGIITVKGPKGSLTRSLRREVAVVKVGNEIHVKMEQDDRQTRAWQGLVRALINNMVVGVSTGFERALEIQGVGYRADLRGGKEILFQLGYSHPILFELPPGVNAEVTKDNKIILRSIDKESLGLAAAKIRSFRAPEPYKGKGIRYAGEKLRQKAGKAAAR